MLYKGNQKICPIITVAGTPTLITKNITENGTYNASSDNADGYSSVTVNVSGGGSSTKYGISMDSILGDIDTNGVLQSPSTNGNLVFTGVQDIAQNGLYYRFYYNPIIKSVSFPNLTTISSQQAMYYTFYGCTSLTSVDLSNLTTLSGSSAMYYTFYNCTSLTSVDLSNLTTLSGNGNAMYYTFRNCTSLTSVDLSSLTTVSAAYAMSNTFQNCTSLTNIDLSSLTTVNGSDALSYTFRDCTNITNIDLSSLTTVNGTYAMYYTFRDCTNITNIDLSSLTTINGQQVMSYTFYGCTKLSSVNFNSLKTIGDNSISINYGHFSSCFNNCTLLTELSFPELEAIYCTGGSTASYGTFASNNKVQKMYFPKLTTITYGSGASSTNRNACKNVFNGCTSLTELHFGSANQSTIEASPGYSTAWGRGAGNVTIYFDL